MGTPDWECHAPSHSNRRSLWQTRNDEADVSGHQKRRSDAWTIPIKVLRQYRLELSALGVTPVRAGVLLYLEQSPGTHAQHCARVLGVTSPTMSLMLRGLQRGGRVKRQRSPQDDRYVLLTLTRKGTDLVRRIRAHLNDPSTGKSSLSPS